MFSIVVVCTRGEASHVTITHDALALTVQFPLDMGPDWTGTSGPTPSCPPWMHGTSVDRDLPC